MTERTGVITFKGNPMTLVGESVEVGADAPSVTLTGTDMSQVELGSFKGRTVILSVVPSLDTPVCDTQTKRFNDAAGQLGEDIVVLTISLDLPFAQRRWCGATGAEHVMTLSDYRGADFGRAYGLLIKELHLLARAVLVVDPKGDVVYSEIVPEVTQEPDYEAALAAARAAANA